MPLCALIQIAVDCLRSLPDWWLWGHSCSENNQMMFRRRSSNDHLRSDSEWTVHGHYHSLARSCNRIRPVFALLATRGVSIAIICALLMLQRQSPRPLAINPLSNNDLGDLRRSNTIQLAISPVRSYKNRRRPAVLISFYLAVMDERRWTVYHKFIVLQERDCSSNISRFDRNRSTIISWLYHNGALSYLHLIVWKRYHIATRSQQSTTASLMVAIGSHRSAMTGILAFERSDSAPVMMFTFKLRFDSDLSV